ncbi:hypothetical protein O3M35_010193 [Rhynocoris fuscipes]|uniref:Uncharacterized protein n=1 Tax=Rhynocoris fuscipes TaxID=488301 RepID=A0AAW1D5R4_9HEMI
MIIMRRKLVKVAGLIVAVGLILVAIIAVIVVKNASYYDSSLSAIPVGAVVSNGGPCSEIGLNILKKYGSVVDSIIATMLCDGVTTMNNMGIGGGFVATIYIRSEGKAYYLNARETAPRNSSADMYHHNATLAQVGGPSVAVPGELKGYWEMYNRFGGKAPWAELFEPTIKLCNEGVPINKHIAANIAHQAKNIQISPTLYALLKNPDGSLPKEGDKVKLPKLAETLKIISKEGPDAMYNGSLSQLLINDIINDGGIMTLDDLADYNIRWEEPVTVSLKNDSLKMYSGPEPSSGSILGFILKLVDGLLETDGMQNKENEQSVTSGIQSIPNLDDTFIITEAFKYAYAIRSRLGDPFFHNVSEVLKQLESPELLKTIRSKLDVNMTSPNASDYGAAFYKEDHGTGNIVVFGPNGDAVVATSTINLIFGSRLVSESTGIILNDEMDDFSVPGVINYFGVPPSPSNFIVPGARPQSSMCPAIFVDSKTGDIKLAIGAAGGTRITTSTAIVALRSLWYNISLEKAIHLPRFHHQLYPMEWKCEADTEKALIEGMKARGHIIKQDKKINSCVTGVLNNGIELEASSDVRRLGNVSYLYLQ